MEQSPHTPAAPEKPGLPEQPLEEIKPGDLASGDIPPYFRRPALDIRDPKIILTGAAILVVLAILLLPPVQIPARISWLGCTQVSAKSPSASGPDGLTVSVESGTLRLKMSKTAQDKLPVAATKAMPTNWTPVSSLYQMTACGSNKAAVTLNVPAEMDSALADTLDLVTWDGKSWQWMGSHADLPGGALVAQLNSLPPNVVVVQTAPAAPVIGAEIPADATLSDRLLADANELFVTGLLISNDGAVQGDPADLPTPVDASHAMFVVTRNWSPDAAVNVGMVQDVLSDARLRTSHVKALTETALKARYAGVAVDYRGIPADMGESFEKFITELAASLHNNQKQLAVVVPAPTPGERSEDRKSVV